jgi:hypothetical protein
LEHDDETPLNRSPTRAGGPSALAATACLCAVVGVTPAAGHDFWLQPDRFTPAAGEAVRVRMYVGHGDAPEPWNVTAARILRFESVGPTGRTDERAALGDVGRVSDALVPLSAGGAYIIALESRASLSELDRDRFEDHARAEGLTAVLKHLAATEIKPGVYREYFSRRAKAFVRSGD